MGVALQWNQTQIATLQIFPVVLASPGDVLEPCLESLQSLGSYSGRPGDSLDASSDLMVSYYSLEASQKTS